MWYNSNEGGDTANNHVHDTMVPFTLQLICILPSHRCMAWHGLINNNIAISNPYLAILSSCWHKNEHHDPHRPPIMPE